MKISLGGSLGTRARGCERAWGYESNVLATHHLWVQKGQMNLVTTVKVRVSPSPVCVLTTKTALRDWQNIICRSLPPPKILRALVTTNVTLCELPNTGFKQPKIAHIVSSKEVCRYYYTLSESDLSSPSPFQPFLRHISQTGNMTARLLVIKFDIQTKFEVKLW